jgi:proteic killer suppression protein
MTGIIPIAETLSSYLWDTTLDAAQDIRTLSTLPGNRPERLRGDRKGQYSIRVNDQWRACFEWRDGHAYEVEIVDYH